jgi:hypothetical protein
MFSSAARIGVGCESDCFNHIIGNRRSRCADMMAYNVLAREIEQIEWIRVARGDCFLINLARAGDFTGVSAGLSRPPREQSAK